MHPLLNKYIIFCLAAWLQTAYGLLVLPIHARQKAVPDHLNQPGWHIEPSPVKMPLNKIEIFPSGRGYIAGKQLLEYDGFRWSISKRQPPQTIDYLFAENENSLIISRLTSVFGSEVYRLASGKWVKMGRMLTNQLTAASMLGGGKVWIAGDREIAFYDGLTPHFIAYPPSIVGIKNIHAPDTKTVYANTLDDKLFYYDGNKWTEVLKGEKIKWLSSRDNKGVVLAESKLYILTEGVWRLHSEDKMLTKVHMAVLSGEGTPWAIGDAGLVLKYTGASWQISGLPVKKYLRDIQMISDSEGWITGDNGLILHYTRSAPPVQRQEQLFGFDVRPIIGIGKNIDDEYGVAIDDINGDGLKDVCAVCLYEPARLYINKSYENPNGEQIVVFNEEGATRGVGGFTGNPTTKNIEIFLGAGLADVDGDGDGDLYLCNLTHGNKLLLNDGNGNFRNVSDQAGRAGGENERTNAAAFADVDNDGDLDIFITSENGSNRLYLNNGAAYFTDITESAGLLSPGAGMGAAFGDINGDGFQDLYVANWAKQNLLYLNVSSQHGGVRFKDVTGISGAGGDPFTKSNAAVFADVDNNGTLDLFVTNRGHSNRLYLNDGSGKFSDITGTAIEADTMLSYGAAIADYNNDGWQDIYVANVGKNILYKNLNGRKFIRAACEIDCLDNGYYTGAASGDVDNDGDTDIYSASYIIGSSVLLLNSINDKNFLTISIEGTESSRDAAGVKVWVYDAGCLNDRAHLLGYREVSSGGGYVSHSSCELHFGLKYGKTYDIAVWFPVSGIRKVLRNVSAGQRLVIKEEAGLQASVTMLGKDIKRLLADREAHYELIKYLLVMLAIGYSVYHGRNLKWRRFSQITMHVSSAAVFIILNQIFAHEQFILSHFLPVAAAIIFLIILHLAYERIILVKLAQAEKQAARDRIARDLHDDLASTISTAIIYTDMLGRAPQEEAQKDMFSKVSSLLNEAAESITDVIWTVSPASDRLQDLIQRLGSMVSEAAQSQNISCRILNMTDTESYNPAISSELKRSIHLIFKEALNNTVKYSGASEITFRAAKAGNEILLVFCDNGRGFNINGDGLTSETPAFRHGNGLLNMRQRAREINAHLSIKSEKEKGTAVELRVKMT